MSSWKSLSSFAACAVPAFVAGYGACALTSRLRHDFLSRVAEKFMMYFHEATRRKDDDDESGDGTTSTGHPLQSGPIKTVEQLVRWQPSELPEQELCRACVPLAVSDHTQKDSCGKPKMLVCHDMRGGYLDDRFVQGNTAAGFYRFWQWDCCDIFVYFSHHLVTVPPPGWINAAHRHSTQMLGTLITEGKSGRSACRRLFGTRAAAEEAAEKLAEIAQFYGFEGWLLNIENPLSTLEVENVLHFTAQLRARLRHLVGPNSFLIWYDSVTIHGWLAWQNTLNWRNEAFLEAAGAIFTNYFWKESHLRQAATAAGSRGCDVFMGVDVFGRGAYGGGMENTHVAVQAIAAAGLSVAVFAPGWVYESQSEGGSFEQRQHVFWEQIRSSWPHHHRPLVSSLPLVSTFNPGCGQSSPNLRHPPCNLHQGPWFNQSCQSLMPPVLPQHWQQDVCAGEAGLQAAVLPASEEGPAMLKLSSSQPLAGQVEVLLFNTDIPIPAGGVDCMWSFRCAPGHHIRIVLHVAADLMKAATAGTQSEEDHPPTGEWGQLKSVVLEGVPKTMAVATKAPSNPFSITTVAGGPVFGLDAFSAVAPTLGATGVEGTGSGAGWHEVRRHVPRSDLKGGSYIRKVLVRCWSDAEAIGSGDGFDACIGELRMTEPEGDQTPNSVEALQCSSLKLSPVLRTETAVSAASSNAGDRERELSCWLEWEEGGGGSHYHVYSAYCLEGGRAPEGAADVGLAGDEVRAFVGTAHATRFFVEGIVLPGRCKEVEWIVQVVGRNGEVQDWKAAARTRVQLH